MKKLLIYGLAVFLVMSSALTSCNSIKNANNTQKGTGIGAAAGALVGGILGNYVGKGGDAVRFDVNKATLTAQAKTNLDKLVSVFNEYSDTNIDIFWLHRQFG